MHGAGVGGLCEPVLLHSSRPRLLRRGDTGRQRLSYHITHAEPRSSPGAQPTLAGKPLPAEDHSAQFGRVDPLVAAVTRTMGAQGVKPLSLELRDEVRAGPGCWYC